MSTNIEIFRIGYLTFIPKKKTITKGEVVQLAI